MARNSEPTRQAILLAGFHLFFSRGYARVSMEEIAREAGITKRTVYHHFDSKDTLVGAVLDNQNEQTIKQFQKWTDPLAPTAIEFCTGLFEKLEDWASKPGWTGSGYTRLALELADLPGHAARKAAKFHKKSIENWLAEELRSRGVFNAERKAIAVALQLEGAMTLSLVHGDITYIRHAREHAEEILA